MDVFKPLSAVIPVFLPIAVGFPGKKILTSSLSHCSLRFVVSRL
jgi:hypothetical protein